MEARKERTNHVKSDWHTHHRVNRRRPGDADCSRGRTRRLSDYDRDRRCRLVCRLLPREAVWLERRAPGQFAASRILAILDRRGDSFAGLSRDQEEKVRGRILNSVSCLLPQSTICTGVFRSTLLKKISSIFPGIRIHPCEAGYPGK